MRIDDTPQQRLSHHAAAGGDDDGSRPDAGGARGLPSAAMHESGVEHWQLAVDGAAEGRLQARERRVAVHEHTMKVPVEEPCNARVMIRMTADENVAEAAEHERSIATGPARVFEHGLELGEELATSEWKELDDDHARPLCAIGFQKQAAALVKGASERAAPIAAEQLPLSIHADRGKLDHLNRLGQSHAARDRATADERDVEVIGQRPDEGERSHQMPHPDGVLAVEQQGGPGVHWLSPSPKHPLGLVHERLQAAKHRPAHSRYRAEGSLAEERGRRVPVDDALRR